MKATVDLYTDGEFVYTTVQKRQYYIGPLDQFVLDHPQLSDKLMAEMRKKQTRR